jgi:SAM-dependent methyltransferase
VCGTPAPATGAFSPHPLRHCPTCDLRFRADIGPEWSEDYVGEADGYARRQELELTGREEQRAVEAYRRAAWVASRVPSGTLLEIGSAAGEFLDAAARRGFEARGIEASPSLSARARARYHLDVDQGLAERHLDGGRRYDVICMWHVLEHARSPADLLAAAASALAPGGWLFVEVPNIASAGARAMGAAWPQLDFEDHAVYFSPPALEAALRRSGFRALELSTILAWEYLSGRDRLRPRRLAGRVHRSVVGRTLRAHHATNGDLLRAVARSRAG